MIPLTLPWGSSAARCGKDREGLRQRARDAAEALFRDERLQLRSLILPADVPAAA